jgi:hypothetical protein
MRRLAMVCARDNASVRGMCGTDIFPEFNSLGSKEIPSIKRGRGIVIAAGIKKLVVTDFCVVCCCVKFALFLMVDRNGRVAEFTENRVVVDWDQIFAQEAMFAKTITDERSSGKKIREGDANNVSCVCREIRGCVDQPKRNLIILKTFEIDALNTVNADNMANKGKWSVEIGKRLGKNFNYDAFSDVILPVTFNQNWVLLILNFE